jgi:hypothetical protein
MKLLKPAFVIFLVFSIFAEIIFLQTQNKVFQKLADLVGIKNGGFKEIFEESGLKRQEISYGAAWSDYDNDGNLDLLIAGSPTTFYRNMGNGTFEDVTDAAGLSNIAAVAGVFGDYDNDGCPDLFINVLSRTPDSGDKLFHNNCKGKFRDATIAAKIEGFLGVRSNTGAAWADYDNDGYLDLYIADNGDYYNLSLTTLNFKPNILYHNNGDGTFTDVTRFAGVDGITQCIPPHSSFSRIKRTINGEIKLSFQPAWLDYNGDNFMDLFVATDGGVSPLYKNNGDGTFTDVTREAGLCMRGTGMGVAVGDYDNDGDFDIYVTNVGVNYMWENNGNETFTEVAKKLSASDPSHVGWGTNFLDYDNDGYLDLYVVNGSGNPGDSILELADDTLDKFYHGTEGKFEDLTEELKITGDDKKEGSAVGDFNNDGYDDIIVLSAARTKKDLNRLYKNVGSGNNWLKIKLRGKKSNRDAVGAKIKLTTGGEMQTRQLESGGSFLSQNSLWQTFGLGKSESVDEVEIKWPSGIVQTLKDIAANQIVTIEEQMN